VAAEVHGRYRVEESMARALTILAASVLLGSVAACGGDSDGGDDRVAPDRIAACTNGMASAVLAPISPTATPSPKLLKAAEALCRDAEDQGLLENEEIARDQARELFQKHARSLFATVCDRLAVTVREALPAEAVNYVTDADVRRFASGWCAVAGDYVHDDASIDVESLLAEHPEVGVPLCAAGVRAGLAESPQPPIPRRNFGDFGRKICTRLFEERLIAVTGPGQFTVRSESPKYDRVVKETVREFAR
jgi:hypothetical protein